MKRMLLAAALATVPMKTRDLPPPKRLVPVYSDNAEGVTKFIQAVAPRVERKRAARLGKLIEGAAKRREVSPLLLASVVAHESWLFKPNLRICYERRGKMLCDHGLGQVNTLKVEELGLDGDRLVEDDAYNLTIVGALLARARKECEGQPTWFSCYHDLRPRPRAAYESKVKPILALAMARQ